MVAMLALSACGGSTPVGAMRFANRAPVWVVNDRLDVPEKPEERTQAMLLYHLDGFIVRPIIRWLDVRDPHRASNVNALDEVPDSTWFTNRIGVRDMTVDEVRRGPNLEEGPEPHKPWIIKGTKIGGASVGFLIEDRRGEKYLLKFDQKGYPEIETAADVIVQRLFWAFGYNTPEDRIVHFERGDLVLADDATVKNPFGVERRMTEADLEERLSKINIVPGKPIRGLVSRFLPGVPLGGYPREGVREDDPNDIVPHEDRRDLRGMYPIASWLGHTDIKEGNTLDIWVQDPADPSRHYVVHYLVDFGKALGTLGFIERRDHSGFSKSTDFGIMLKSLFSFGLWRRDWEGIQPPGLRGIGLWEADKFRPGAFSTHTPYFPFADMDRFDGFWGAKIMMRFTPAHIRAVVDEAQYSDPRAADYMVETLLARQRKVGRYWFSRVNPLDRFTVREDDAGITLCFEDLLVLYGLDTPGETTSYSASSFDGEGAFTGWTKGVPATGSGRVCIENVRAGRSNDGYLMVRLVTRRGERLLPGVVVHLARDPASKALRVIGLRRQ